MRHLMRPLQEYLALGRAEFLGDLLDDRIDGPARVTDERGERPVGFDVDALGVAEGEEGFGDVVDVGVDLDLCAGPWLAR
jgi:hypothetical protein